MLAMAGNKIKIRRIIALFLIFILGVSIIAIAFNSDTIRGRYKTEIEDIVIRVPSLSVKGTKNTIVHPHLYIFYTIHDKAYVENFFAMQVFSDMEKIQYGYENMEMGIAIEDFIVYETYQVLGLIPITKYSFSYRNTR